MRKIGKYEVTGMLGTGSQGTVLAALDRNLMRNVAIKVLRGGSSPYDLERLNMEARNVSRLRHPNVVTLLDYGTQDKHPYLVFELLEGTSLRDQIRSTGSLGLKRSVVLMSQILGGVAAAHAVKIIHCDLSPGNIIITPQNLPKVMDFGLSSVVASHSINTGSLAGTPRYMSPEMLSDTTVGPGSDVFALGAIFYEMLTGEVHFCESNIAELFAAIGNCEPKLPSRKNPEVPPVVDEVVQRALAKDPSQRFSNAQAMKELLDTFRVTRENTAEEVHATVEFLMRRIKHARGFSALSQRIDDVIKLTSSDKSGGDAQRLSKLLAKDVTLSRKVLTAANSAFHGGREIRTLSQAVVWMGMEAVRQYVTSCIVQTEFSQGSRALRVAIVSSFLTGMLCKELSVALQQRCKEDAFLMGMFHNLGRMLVIHYIPEEFELITAGRTSVEDEISRCREILGVPYHVIGKQAGKQWQLPGHLLDAMTPLPRGVVEGAQQPETTLMLLAALSNTIAWSFELEDAPDSASLNGLFERTRALLPLEPLAIADILSSVCELSEKYAATIGVTSDTDWLFERIRAWCEALQAEQKQSEESARHIA